MLVFQKTQQVSAALKQLETKDYDTGEITSRFYIEDKEFFYVDESLIDKTLIPFNFRKATL